MSGNMRRAKRWTRPDPIDRCDWLGETDQRRVGHPDAHHVPSPVATTNNY